MNSRYVVLVYIHVLYILYMYIITLFWKPQQVPYLKGKEPAAFGDLKPNVELKCSRFTEGRGHLPFLCWYFVRPKHVHKFPVASETIKIYH